jgi:predicted nucleotidyltransferase component of viral defense system
MIEASAVSMKLLAYARKCGVNHQILLIRFFHERFLYRVSVSEFSAHLLLKGGHFLYATQGKMARPTIDIDFSGVQLSNNTREIESIFKHIIAIRVNDAVVFDADTLMCNAINEQNQYAGIRIKVIAKLGNIRQNIQIDIGFGDVITPSPIVLQYPVLLEEFEVPVVYACSMETVIAEKLQAIIVLAQLNSRMKDFYDIYTLLNAHIIDYQMQKEAIIQTFANRNTPLNFETAVFTADFYEHESLQNMWKAFLKKINAEDVAFGTVVNCIEHFVKKTFNEA